jgi:molybdate transport system substrate-binding protein
MARVYLGLLAVTTLAALAGCAAANPATASGPTDRATVDVYAAASLTDVFTQLGRDFEADNPGVKLTFTFAGSSDLAAQINELAPADVFASANATQMEVAREHIVGEPQFFTHNVLAIAVADGNPLRISSLEDLAREDVVTVACAKQVPCGSAAATLFASAGVHVSPASEEANVTDVLGKVAAGEADAGLVYVTDLARAHGVEGVAIANTERAINRYPIAVMDTGDAPRAGADFVDFVQSAKGQAVLTAAGFQAAS